MASAEDAASATTATGCSCRTTTRASSRTTHWRTTALAVNDTWEDTLGGWYDAADGVADREAIDGNIGLDPAFYDRARRDYDLDIVSACRDVGWTAAELDVWLSAYGASLTTDHDGNPRSTTDAWDLGAFED